MLTIRTTREQLQTKPKCVLFDLDHTLYDYDEAHKLAVREVCRKMQENLGISPSMFHRLFDEARAHVKTRLGGTASSHSRLLYFQKMIELVGLKSDVVSALDYEQTYWRSFFYGSKLFPHAKETLLLIRSLGIPLVLVTDLTAQIQFRKIIYFGLETVFDFVVTSEEAGADKPAGIMFEIARQKAGFAKEDRVWMFGDDGVRDGSVKNSLNALFFLRRSSQWTKKTSESADVGFDSYEDLDEVLDPFMNSVKR
jgi:putative hydrolase of the HAD superfamily